ncbi:MAG: double-strand break repair protein AddB [Silicimonas sp.]|nr:double-strand break repair protein AddB [Silicimonas sp.]
MTDTPKVAGVPPGADFVQVLHDRIASLAKPSQPEAIAGIQVLLPTRRMQRRLTHLFETAGNSVLPRIGLVTDVAHLLSVPPAKRQVGKLRRTLDLKAVVSHLVALDDHLSENDTIALATSLAALLDEMHGEGVPFDRIEDIAPDDISGHWDRSLAFLRTIRGYVEALEEDAADAEALTRASVEALCAQWEQTPPQTPVILAGSTGSRATTRMLMAAVAALPQGLVLLPGFDFDLPPEIWRTLARDRAHEDHPQFRFAAFLDDIGLAPGDVPQLGDARDTSRNRLVSLSLRPAPVTDQWLSQGPTLGDLRPATDALTLIEARDAKAEAEAIALAMRAAIDKGQTVALIAPDATLARRTTAALNRWSILPDDSGGMPLSLTTPGRFIRQTLRLAAGHAGPVELISLLKHPLTRAGDGRGDHMLATQKFEVFLRKNRLPDVTADAVRHFATSHDEEPWAAWLAAAITLAAETPANTIADVLAHHLAVTQAFTGSDLTELAKGDAGEKVLLLLDVFEAEAATGAPLTFHEYEQLLDRALSADSARTQDGVRPDAMIWGTLEARVQGADVVIIGGLNEGIWPQQPEADPWLNRDMRRQIGLLLPERQIGLAAHDFQQAIGAPQVILTRAIRSDGAETVPSRWLSRLTNLLAGLESTHGLEALNAMHNRGAAYLLGVESLDRPGTDPAPANRPAPAPPSQIRPRTYSVTEIQRLIRDPYAVYARRILNLKPLDPLTPEIDARQKGEVFHKILERFYDPAADLIDADTERQRLAAIVTETLEALVHDPTTRVEWKAQFDANATWLIDEEFKRRASATPLAREVKGEFVLPGTPFSLIGKADRIDRLHTGGLVIYDYKSGTPPKPKDITLFDRQLILEAVMAEHGAFDGIPPETVARVVHLGVGRSPDTRETQLTDHNETVTVSGQLVDLLTKFADRGTGYTSRRAMDGLRYSGDYDHLARYGEWDESKPADTEPLE